MRWNESPPDRVAAGWHAARKLAALCAAAMLLMGPTSALADSFSFHYGNGPWHAHPRYHHRRRVIIAPPPNVIYVAPPQVIYMPAPAPSAPPIPANAVSPVYQDRTGHYCREYQANIVVNGRSQPSYGTACLQPDGTWRIVN